MFNSDPQKKLSQQVQGNRSQVKKEVEAPSGVPPKPPQSGGPIPISPDDGWLKKQAKKYGNRKIQSAMGGGETKDPGAGGQQDLPSDGQNLSPTKKQASPDPGAPKPNVPKRGGTPTPKVPKPQIPKFRR